MTGGCGFIGSHVVDALVERDVDVVVFDNLSTGFDRHLDEARKRGSVRLVVGDILNQNELIAAGRGVDAVFHFAGHADVRRGLHDTHVDLNQNTIGTLHALEACRAAGAELFVLASSATVYGEPQVFPTPESSPLIQTSAYGASKLAAEAFTHAFAEYFDLRTLCFRFVSWIGERYSHGVIFDFVNKIHQHPDHLPILGDGTQKKSYLHVEDGIRAIFCAVDHAQDRKGVFNVGHDDIVDVRALAHLVIDECQLSDVRLTFSDGTRGWIGDSPLVQLDTTRLKALGWTPRISVEAGIRRTARYLLEHDWIFSRCNPRDDLTLSRLPANKASQFGSR